MTWWSNPSKFLKELFKTWAYNIPIYSIYIYVYCHTHIQKVSLFPDVLGVFLFFGRSVSYHSTNLRPRSVNSYSWSVALSRWKDQKSLFFSHFLFEKKEMKLPPFVSQCMNIITIKKKGRGCPRGFPQGWQESQPHLPGFWLNASSAI